MAKKGRIIGIDLGTTNSAVAVVDMGGPRILQNRENEQLTRSVVGYFKGEFLTGTPAMQRWPSAPEDTIVSIKRLMGRSINDKEVERIKKWALYRVVEPSDGTRDSVNVIMGGKEYSPVDVSAMILKKLKEDAEFVLGEEVTHAVITVPAYFSDKQRHATKLAGLKAGLTVMKILEEPTAAAIAYGLESKERDAKIFLVYDLGGGTFDISVLMMTAGAFSPLNLEGDMWLGGDNFDQVIVDFVTEYVRKEFKIDPMLLDPKTKGRFLSTLKMEARKAKETLSQARLAPIYIPSLLMGPDGPIDIEVDITREQFEEMIRPLVDRSISLVKKAMENAQFTIDDIDSVLMAGNSTGVPLVQEAVEKLVGKDKILRKIHPKFCVAIGAAIAAAVYSRVHCDSCGHDNELDAEVCKKCGQSLNSVSQAVDVPQSPHEYREPAAGMSELKNELIEVRIGHIAPFNYGIQTAGDRFNIFIFKNDPYETPEDKRIFQTFTTRFPGQRIISIPVYGGDDLENASKNEKQGEAFAILPPHLPAETGVRIKMWLNGNGEFDLEARMENGTALKPWILRGGEDQKAKEIYESVVESLLKKIDHMLPEDRNKAEQMHNRILDCLNVRQFKEVENAIKELTDFLDGLKSPVQPLPPTEQIMLNYAMYIVNDFSWLLGAAAYELNLLIGALRDAIEKNDPAMKEQALAQLEAKLESLMFEKDPYSGKQIPSLLSDCLAVRGVINSVIYPKDPEMALRLENEFKSVENAFKNNQPNGNNLFNDFCHKMEQMIQKLPKEGMECPACGHINPTGTHFCANCKADLWMIGSRMGAAASSKDFPRR